METKKTKVLIIGSGPAGCTAAIYLARANLNPVMVMGEQHGGQLTITTDVENYPGFKDPIQGPFLMEEMIEQSRRSGTILDASYIKSVDFSKKPFECRTDKTIYLADAVIISTGAKASWLGLESEEKFRGFGVSACATCDGFFFRNQDVLVVGGGNTAVEEALYLSKIAKKVYLVHRRDSLRAEKVMQDKLFKNEKIQVIWNSNLKEVLGEENPKKVTGCIIENNQGIKKQIDVDGIFIAIGHKPNSELFLNQIDVDSDGYVIANNTKTNIPGVFAAGDIQDKIYRQAVTSAGSGCIAALEACNFLEN